MKQFSFYHPNWYGSAFCWELAGRIKQQFAQFLGPYIRCSIGIAPNSLLAKVATNLQKPDGIVEITVENIPNVLQKLSLTDLPGIARQNANRLATSGITTPLQLYEAPSEQLYKQFGIWGQQWWWRLHGYEPDCHQNTSKSISHQHVLKKWLPSVDEAIPVITRMSDRLIHRLNRNNWSCLQVFSI